MVADLLFILGISAFFFALLEIFLSGSQKKAVEETTYKIWYFIEEMKGRAYLDWLRRHLDTFWSSAVAAAVSTGIFLLIGYASSYEDDWQVRVIGFAIGTPLIALIGPYFVTRLLQPLRPVAAVANMVVGLALICLPGWLAYQMIEVGYRGVPAAVFHGASAKS